MQNVDKHRTLNAPFTFFVVTHPSETGRSHRVCRLGTLPPLCASARLSAARIGCNIIAIIHPESIGKSKLGNPNWAI
jgi:hypothetical protein